MTDTVNSTPTQRLQQLKQAVEVINTEKIGAIKEHDLLKKQHAEKLAELKTLGIESVKDIPGEIQKLEAEISQLLSTAETSVADINTKLGLQ